METLPAHNHNGAASQPYTKRVYPLGTRSLKLRFPINLHSSRNVHKSGSQAVGFEHPAVCTRKINERRALTKVSTLIPRVLQLPHPSSQTVKPHLSFLRLGSSDSSSTFLCVKVLGIRSCGPWQFSIFVSVTSCEYAGLMKVPIQEEIKEEELKP